MARARFSRKKKRMGSGVFRITQEQHAQARRKILIRRLVIGFAFVVLVASITRPFTTDSQTPYTDVKAGDVARESVYAEFTFNSEDLEATRTKREKAAGLVSNTYRVDESRVKQQIKNLKDIVDLALLQKKPLDSALRKALLSSSPAQTKESVVDQALRDYAEQLKKTQPEVKDLSTETLAYWLSPRLETVPTRVFPENGESTAPQLNDPAGGALEFAQLDSLASLTRAALDNILRYGVMDALDRSRELSENPDRPVMIHRDVPASGQIEKEEVRLDAIPFPAIAKDWLQKEIQDVVESGSTESSVTPVDWDEMKKAAQEVAQLFLAPTLIYDDAFTEGAREAVRAKQDPVTRPIEAGQVVQRQGERWTEQSVIDYRAYLQEKNRPNKPFLAVLSTLLAHGILVALTLACLIRALPLLKERRADDFQHLGVALLLLCAVAVLGRIVSFFEPTGFLVPAAAAVILAAILTNVRLAAMVGMLSSFLLCLQFNYDWRLLVVMCAMCFGGLLSIVKVRRRGDMNRGAVFATIVGLLTAFAVVLATDNIFSDTARQLVFLIALNGVICLFVVPALLSPLERLFGITTDMQLLEYSDLNNELLSRLAIEVPATYSHSLVMGYLAEAAADAIGANGLLGRVCALYHDIGKTKRPEYFTENQTGTNVHDSMPPRLSARAIASHVTQGAEMAREFHLPKPIIDAIFEHHGTFFVGCFYQEAMKLKRHGDVQESDFRYPGPKPQSRETAILMICDASESAVRSLKNPNEERVRELVDKLITLRAEDRQFDECDLTLRDLDTVAEVISKRLTTSMHRRVAYPDQKPAQTAPNVIAITSNQDS